MLNFTPQKWIGFKFGVQIPYSILYSYKCNKLYSKGVAENKYSAGMNHCMAEIFEVVFISIPPCSD